MSGSRVRSGDERLDADDLEDIAIGGAILGTGGGGDPYIGKLMAQQAILKHGPVKLVDVAEQYCAGGVGGVGGVFVTSTR